MRITSNAFVEKSCPKFYCEKVGRHFVLTFPHVRWRNELRIAVVGDLFNAMLARP